MPYNLKSILRKPILSSISGQTLLEVVVVIGVGVIVIGAIVFATIASLRNAQFASDQSRATGLAQDGLERARSIRDRNGSVSYSGISVNNFSDLYNFQFSCTNPAVESCYFILSPGGNSLTGNVSSATYEALDSGFQRQVLIEDGNNASNEKKITVVVNWSDYSGVHTSRLSTTLGKL